MVSRYSLIFSFCLTPKRCSSSITSNPKSLNATSFDKIRCVPINKSILPSLTSFKIRFFSLDEVKRLSKAISTGKFLKRSVAVLKCCIDKIVVGQRKATCL